MQVVPITETLTVGVGLLKQTRWPPARRGEESPAAPAGRRPPINIGEACDSGRRAGNESVAPLDAGPSAVHPTASARSSTLRSRGNSPGLLLENRLPVGQSRRAWEAARALAACRHRVRTALGRLEDAGQVRRPARRAVRRRGESAPSETADPGNIRPRPVTILCLRQDPLGGRHSFRRRGRHSFRRRSRRHRDYPWVQCD